MAERIFACSQQAAVTLFRGNTDFTQAVGAAKVFINGSYGNGSNMSWDDPGTAVSGAGVHVTWDSLLPH